MFVRIIAALALSAASLALHGAPSQLVLDVQGMTCATCPITVRTVLKKLPGVEAVKVDMEARTAAVTYDPARVSPERIAKAVTEAGFPSAPRK